MKRREISASEAGFTLIEVMMALIVFAMISALAYSALGTAGNGFQILNETRAAQERASWVGKQLRRDLRYLSPAPMIAAGEASKQTMVVPLRIKNDNRGDVDLDELWLLVREPGATGISQIHYYIDESNDHLIRESRALLARPSVEPARWDFGKIRSWAVQVWDQQGNRRQDWRFSRANFIWPRAVEVRMQVDASARLDARQRWLVPIWIGQQL